jgi:hypothetical protein
MAKRFIDTGLFDDEWFMNLSQDGKLLWIYFITKCDHAGILKFNVKLCKLQTDIKSIDTVIKELGNRLIPVSEHLFFIPKFIEYQYPGFPNSKVRQQQSAVDILTKYKLFDKGMITVSKESAISEIIFNKELLNTYDNGNVNEHENVHVNIEFDVFWKLYDKNIDHVKCESLWNNLTEVERINCITKLPSYIKNTKNKQFRKNPENYLKYKSWINEILSRFNPNLNNSEVVIYDNLITDDTR